jgi:hypothetical protein
MRLPALFPCYIWENGGGVRLRGHDECIDRSLLERSRLVDSFVGIWYPGARLDPSIDTYPFAERRTKPTTSELREVALCRGRISTAFGRRFGLSVTAIHERRFDQPASNAIRRGQNGSLEKNEPVNFPLRHSHVVASSIGDDTPEEQPNVTIVSRTCDIDPLACPFS